MRAWPWLALVACGLWSLGGILWVYLDLRIHALRQSGDLPRPSRRGRRLSGPYTATGRAIEGFKVLYSQDYLETDAHSRRLVPVIRVCVPLAVALIGLCVVIEVLGR